MPQTNETTPRQKNGARHGKDTEVDVAEATKEYVAENSEIILALEAMRRSQLVQEKRVGHLLRQVPYYIGID